MPDLVVIRSTSLIDTKAPWSDADKAWTTDWIQYASTDSNQHFINIIFFDKTGASDRDRQEVVAYLDGLVCAGASYRRYRSDSSGSHISTLPLAPVIECGPGSASSYLVGTADTLPPDWMLRYSLVDHAGSARQAPHQPSLTMIVQPAGDVRAQTVTQQGVYATPPVNEFRNNSNQHEVGNERDSIVLYVVACSASLEADNSNGSTFEWATTSGEIDIS